MEKEAYFTIVLSHQRLTLSPDSIKRIYFESAKLLHITGVFPAIDEKNMEIIHAAISEAKKTGGAHFV